MATVEERVKAITTKKLGVDEIKGERVIAMTFLEGRNPDWVIRPFFARYDEKAVWFDELKPAFGEKRFFFQED